MILSMQIDIISVNREFFIKYNFWYFYFSFNLSANSERAPKVRMLCQIWSKNYVPVQSYPTWGITVMVKKG